MNLSGSSYSFIEQVLFPSTLISKKQLKERVLNKTILITGASYGIGESLVHLLSEYSLRMILLARSHDKLSELQIRYKDNPAEIIVYPVDLKHLDQVDSVLEHLIQQDVSIDIFINNAGKSIRRSLQDSYHRYYDFQNLMTLHYLTPVKIITKLYPILKKNHGQIINISGLNVLLPPMPYWSSYQSSKIAMYQWLESNKIEMLANDIRMCTIFYPIVKTRMIEPNQLYQKLPGLSSEHAAKWILKSIIHNKNRYPWWFPIVLPFILISQFFISIYWKKKINGKTL